MLLYFFANYKKQIQLIQFIGFLYFYTDFQYRNLFYLISKELNLILKNVKK